MKYDISFTTANPKHLASNSVETDSRGVALALFSALSVSADVVEVRLYEGLALLLETPFVEACKWRQSK
jgi:hypothetical protein